MLKSKVYIEEEEETDELALNEMIPTKIYNSILKDYSNKEKLL